MLPEGHGGEGVMVPALRKGAYGHLDTSRKSTVRHLLNSFFCGFHPGNSLGLMFLFYRWGKLRDRKVLG